MKKLLFLGGSYSQVPAIKRAVEFGYYVITADYLPNNPGHKFSHEYYNVSTTDKEAILKLAIKLSIDGIIAYASDPGAPVAAYVATKLNLPSSPLESIEILGEKHLWRRFLCDNGFNVPMSQSGVLLSDFNLDKLKFPIMVKPVDSSGSKGVTKVNATDEFLDAFVYAQEYSRNKIIIAEEFVEKVGCQIGGDGFYGNDRLEFVCFGDQFVDKEVNPFVPAGMMFPSAIDRHLKEKISAEIERALQCLNVTNLSFNLEVMLDKEEKIYLMEIGPRNGGNFIPQVIEYLTEISLVDLALKSAVKDEIIIKSEVKEEGVYGYYAIHSDKEGYLQDVKYTFPYSIELLNEYRFIANGLEVQKFNGSNCTIGIIVLKFEDRSVMNLFYAKSGNFIKVNVE